MTHYFPFLTLFGARRKPLLAVSAAALFCSLLFALTAPLVAQDADTMVYTVQAGDTMEHCLQRGRELGVAQFPVLEGTRLVGVISANEIFQLAAHCLAGSRQQPGAAGISTRSAH